MRGLPEGGEEGNTTDATCTSVADAVGVRYALRGTIDTVLYDSADSYSQSRLIYLQNRRFELNDFSSGDLETVSGEGEAASASDPYADPYLDPYADPYAQ